MKDSATPRYHDMTGQVLERAEAAVKSGAEVEILRFAA